MRITIVCRQQLYDRIMLPLQDIPGLECSPALSRWPEFNQWIENGADGIILEEGIPISDQILTMPFPNFTFDNGREYPGKVTKWIQSLNIRMEKMEKLTEEYPGEQKQDEPSDLFWVENVPIESVKKTEEHESLPSLNKESEQALQVEAIPFTPPRRKRIYSTLAEQNHEKEKVRDSFYDSPSLPKEEVQLSSQVQLTPLYLFCNAPVKAVEEKEIEEPIREMVREPDPVPQVAQPNEMWEEPSRPSITIREEVGGNIHSSSIVSPETITVFSGKGGVGVDTFSLHLAGLYEKAGIKTSVIDLALPFGHISTYLNVAPSSYATDMIQRENNFYWAESELKRMTVENRNIHYYLPPNQWEVGFRYDEAMLDKILRNMQRLGSITICNLNSYHDWKSQLMTFSLSTKIYWLLDMNKATIFHTKRQLVTLREMGFASQDKIHFVLNRVVNQDLDVYMIEEALGGRIVLQLPEDKEVATAMNHHMILTQTNKSTPYANKLSTLVSLNKESAAGKIAKLLRGR